MINWLICAATALLPADTSAQRIVLAEQSQHRIVIADVPAQQIIWEWKPALSNVKPAHMKWFNNPSEAKVVYDGKYVLTCASGGGVALVRIADKKTVFYAYAGGNTHSAELLPDGNIVTASSTDNYLMLFSVDTLHAPGEIYSKKIPIAFGHNVVWDKQRKLLWSAAMSELKAFRYNFNKAQPDLIPDTVIALPGTEAHDLFPVYGEDALWLTNTTHVYKYKLSAHQPEQCNTPYQAHIKSISSGPAGVPVIIIKPKTSWWTDEVIDTTGKRIFFGEGLKIYKARWVLPNSFSYAP
ncbi:DUF6528 family protein [uncultured Chitinophaga sp.]|jgi:hypothetical protein|uniref:DUF6528 family protein n=1 Tax=uncultured Chitinophaga sp. TaxID=339340 RepID=UPI00262ED999|nr:DUF6528 family protein [uncultured Chitinophaga sp.]